MGVRCTSMIQSSKHHDIHQQMFQCMILIRKFNNFHGSHCRKLKCAKFTWFFFVYETDCICGTECPETFDSKIDFKRISTHKTMVPKIKHYIADHTLIAFGLLFLSLKFSSIQFVFVVVVFRG